MYAASSAALAVLEMLAHLASERILPAYRLIRIFFDEALVERLDPSMLPSGWRSNPAPSRTQTIGDAWAAERRSAVLVVPSTIVPVESNYLLNPDHPDFHRIAIGEPEPFDLDPRVGPAFH